MNGTMWPVAFCDWFLPDGILLNTKEIVNNVTHVPNSVLSFHYDVYEYLKIQISKCFEQLFALQGVSQHHLR